MRRGTTPTHVFNTDIDLSGAEVIYVTYQQNGKTIIEKTRDSLEVTEDTVVVHLTQAETLLFSQGSNAQQVRVQIRAKWPGSGQAVASNVVQTTVKEILKEGEI